MKDLQQLNMILKIMKIIHLLIGFKQTLIKDQKDKLSLSQIK